MANSTTAQLEAERDFLLARAQAANLEFTAERWTGMSSDTLVAYAFGQGDPKCNYLSGLLEFFRQGVERKYPNAVARVQGYLAADPPFQGMLA